MSFMETLGRIPKILEANVNALLDKCENPEKMINQMLVDAKRDLVEVKKSTAEVMADMEIAKKRLDEANESIARKEKAAEAAIVAGNEDDARTLLASKQQAEVSRDQLKKNYEICVNNANQMKAAYNKLVNDIDTLEQRATVAKSQFKMAEAQENIQKVTAKAGSTKIADSFARYEEKAQRALAEASAAAELDAQIETADQIMQKYENSGSNPSVDNELAALKAKLGMQ